MTILILGGGASGMMAALAASECGRHRVVLVERQARLGRKLLATGNGRCNLTNIHANGDSYHGADPAFCRPALEAFPVADTLDYFHGLGLLTVTEPSGRVYPYSDQANSVLDVLRFALEQAGVEVHTGCEVRKIWKRRDGFLLKWDGGEAAGDKLILAAGGAAGAKLGGTTLGYDLLGSLGHKSTALHPALVQLCTEGTFTRGLKGVRANGRVTVLRGSRVLAVTEGEIQFTETGVSGPAVFEISRAVSTGGDGLTLSLNLLPQLSEEAIVTLLQTRCTRLPDRPAEDLLTGMVHNRLGKLLGKAAGIGAEERLSTLGPDRLDRLADTIGDLRLTVTGTMGMDNAQVTVGGVETAGFDPQTLESRKVPGLYACGEVLDIDGDCGGYNLQWAWSSGRLAGLSASKETEES